MTDLQQPPSSPSAAAAHRPPPAAWWAPSCSSPSRSSRASASPGTSAAARAQRPPPTSTGSKTGDVDAALSPSANGDQTAAIAALQATLRTNPDNAAGWGTLGARLRRPGPRHRRPAVRHHGRRARSKKSLALDTTDNFIGVRRARPRSPRPGTSSRRPRPARSRASRSTATTPRCTAFWPTRRPSSASTRRRGLRTEDAQPAAADAGAVPCLVRRGARGQPALGRLADDAGPRRGREPRTTPRSPTTTSASWPATPATRPRP